MTSLSQKELRHLFTQEDEDPSIRSEYVIGTGCWHIYVDDKFVGTYGVDDE